MSFDDVDEVEHDCDEDGHCSDYDDGFDCCYCGVSNPDGPESEDEEIL
jgi:hypothetical protein